MDKKEVRKKNKREKKEQAGQETGEKKILQICILYRSQDFQKGRENWMTEK